MVRDLLQEAYDAMRHNRRRTALTMLGMAWGIATVVMLLAWGNGFGQACANIFANFGTKLVIVVPGRHRGWRPEGGQGHPIHLGRCGYAEHQSSSDFSNHARGQ
jgi:MacB-like periplasmic core domain